MVSGGQVSCLDDRRSEVLVAVPLNLGPLLGQNGLSHIIEKIDPFSGS